MRVEHRGFAHSWECNVLKIQEQPLIQAPAAKRGSPRKPGDSMPFGQKTPSAAYEGRSKASQEAEDGQRHQPPRRLVRPLRLHCVQLGEKQPKTEGSSARPHVSRPGLVPWRNAFPGEAGGNVPRAKRKGRFPGPGRVALNVAGAPRRSIEHPEASWRNDRLELGRAGARAPPLDIFDLASRLAERIV